MEELMEAHFRTRGPDVWHVTDEGKKKNEIKTERQRDAIAKSTILSFCLWQCVQMVFLLAQIHMCFWNNISENHGDSNNVQIKKHVLIYVRIYIEEVSNLDTN